MIEGVPDKAVNVSSPRGSSAVLKRPGPIAVGKTNRPVGRAKSCAHLIVFDVAVGGGIAGGQRSGRSSRVATWQPTDGQLSLDHSIFIYSLSTKNNACGNYQPIRGDDNQHGSPKDIQKQASSLRVSESCGTLILKIDLGTETAKNERVLEFQYAPQGLQC